MPPKLFHGPRGGGIGGGGGGGRGLGLLNMPGPDGGSGGLNTPGGGGGGGTGIGGGGGGGRAQWPSGLLKNGGGTFSIRGGIGTGRRCLIGILKPELGTIGSDIAEELAGTIGWMVVSTEDVSIGVSDLTSKGISASAGMFLPFWSGNIWFSSEIFFTWLLSFEVAWISSITSLLELLSFLWIKDSWLSVKALPVTPSLSMTVLILSSFTITSSIFAVFFSSGSCMRPPSLSSVTLSVRLLLSSAGSSHIWSWWSSTLSNESAVDAIFSFNSAGVANWLPPLEGLPLTESDNPTDPEQVTSIADSGPWVERTLVVDGVCSGTSDLVPAADAWSMCSSILWMGITPLLSRIPALSTCTVSFVSAGGETGSTSIDPFDKVCKSVLCVDANDSTGVISGLTEDGTCILSDKTSISSDGSCLSSAPGTLSFSRTSLSSRAELFPAITPMIESWSTLRCKDSSWEEIPLLSKTCSAATAVAKLAADLLDGRLVSSAVERRRL